jgi:hypothetical protein
MSKSHNCTGEHKNIYHENIFTLIMGSSKSKIHQSIIMLLRNSYDAWVHCTQPEQVLVLYGTEELRIENSSKVKAKKVYLPKRESRRLLLN